MVEYQSRSSQMSAMYLILYWELTFHPAFADCEISILDRKAEKRRGCSAGVMKKLDRKVEQDHLMRLERFPSTTMASGLKPAILSWMAFSDLSSEIRQTTVCRRRKLFLALLPRPWNGCR